MNTRFYGVFSHTSKDFASLKLNEFTFLYIWASLKVPNMKDYKNKLNSDCNATPSKEMSPVFSSDSLSKQNISSIRQLIEKMPEFWFRQQIQQQRWLHLYSLNSIAANLLASYCIELTFWIRRNPDWVISQIWSNLGFFFIKSNLCWSWLKLYHLKTLGWLILILFYSIVVYSCLLMLQSRPEGFTKENG